MLCDQPGVRADDGRGAARRAAARRRSPRARTPTAAAIRSLSARSVFDELASLHGDKGVWRLLDRHADEWPTCRSRARSRATSILGRTIRRGEFGGCLMRAVSLTRSQALGRRAATAWRRGDGRRDEEVGAAAGGHEDGASTSAATSSAPSPAAASRAPWSRSPRAIIDGAAVAPAALRDRRLGRLGRRAAVRRRDLDLGASLRAGGLQSRFSDWRDRHPCGARDAVEGGPELGAKLLREGAEPRGHARRPDARRGASELAREAMWTERNELHEVRGAKVFIDVAAPPPRLIIVGAVDFAAQLSEVARMPIGGRSWSTRAPGSPPRPGSPRPSA